MDSKQIKAMLKPMADFAPAILKAAEIVEAVEAAEKRSKAIDKEIDGKNKELAEVQRQVLDFKAKGDAARAAHLALVQDLAKQREEIAASMQGARNELATEREALREAVSEKNTILADLNGQINEQKKALANVKTEIERLKKAFAA